MANRNYLFICSSDLADVDVNGRTVRDTFSFINDENIYCVSGTRLNKNLKNDQVFLISDFLIKKFKFFGKFYHQDVQELKSFVDDSLNKHALKSPLLCLFRTLIWKISFLFWKRPLYKWIKKSNIDALVYNVGDFSFNNYLATKIAKKFKIKLIIYNTEFYYFKTWNYLKKQNLFYPLFINNFRKSFNKTMKFTDLCVYNLQELADLYAKQFPNNKHCAFLHSSSIKQTLNSKKPLSDSPLFYYAGSLDKRRHVPLFSFSKCVEKVFPKSQILIHGSLGNYLKIDDFKDYKNINYKGMQKYDEIVKKLMSNDIVLLSLSPIDDYAAKNNYYGFSTKLADAIASLNPIIHIGTKNVETDLLEKNELAYVAFNENGVAQLVKTLKDDVKLGKLVFAKNQADYAAKYLDQDKNANQLKDILDEILN